jgi:hypothetical protein
MCDLLIGNASLTDAWGLQELEEVAQQAAEGASATGPGTKQSRLVTGATLKDYQVSNLLPKSLFK